MSEVIIADRKAYDAKRAQLRSERLHVVADFDKTLTRAFYNGGQYHSTIALVRDGGYLGAEYVAQSKQLFAKYHPIERDASISRQEVSVAMEEWWSAHWSLMVKSGMNAGVIDDIVSKRLIHAREHLREFVDVLEARRVPLLILSAGLGNVIEGFLRAEGLIRENVKVLSNFFTFDSNGLANGFTHPLIHSFNKSEAQMPPGHFARRDQVLLLGDSLGDLGMSAQTNHDMELRVGFANTPEDEQPFKRHFDMVITQDGPLLPVVEILRSLR